LDEQDNTQLYGDLIATYNKQVTEGIGIVATVGSSIQDLHSGYQDFFDSKGGTSFLLTSSMSAISI
jgi:hypothetical protein